MERVLLPTLAIILLSGCISLKDHSPKSLKKLEITKENLNSLEGRFKYKQDTVFGEIMRRPFTSFSGSNRSLTKRMFVFFPNSDYRNETEIELAFINSKKLRVSKYDGDSLLGSKLISGKIKNGYFYIRPRILIIPTFPLLYVHNFQQTRLALTGEDLIVDESVRMWAFAIIAGESNKGTNTAIYTRIK
tara:strand:- start:6492 stop:7058 length:567 start_codon:yes stop_codon:yes gene_type:complete